jgi:hypothetical protein
MITAASLQGREGYRDLFHALSHHWRAYEEKKDAEAPSNEKLRRGFLEVKHNGIF